MQPSLPGAQTNDSRTLVTPLQCSGPAIPLVTWVPQIATGCEKAACQHPTTPGTISTWSCHEALNDKGSLSAAQE